MSTYRNERYGKYRIKTAVSRREAIKMMGSAALMGAAGLGWPRTSPAATWKKRPNIVFILTDDHRWDCLGAAGHPFLQTPHMDRLAREGVMFDNAFVTTSLCSPSRASFLTGQYASVHGVQSNFSRWDEQKNITFLEHLSRSGYDTAFVGKWHMPGGELPRLPGVDQFVSFTRKDGQGDYYNCPIFVNHQPVKNRREYITEELTDYAVDFVRQGRDNPFCLYLSHKAVHHDWRPPPHLKGKYDDVDLGHLAPESDRYNTWSGLNWLEGTMGDMHTIYRRYCECIESVDEQVGRLLVALDAMGVMDNTLIVYAGDNGYIWGEHRLYAKHWPYEESIRIPYIVKPPSNLPVRPGTRDSRMVLNIDLAPSLLETAGIPTPDAMQGDSFLPLLASADAPGRKAWLYELFHDFPFGGRVPPHNAVRTNRYKYIEWKSCREPEIYDLAADPRELNNLWGTGVGKSLQAPLQGELAALRKRYRIV